MRMTDRSITARGRQSPFNWPSAFYSHVESKRFHMKFFSPVFQTQGLAPIGEPGCAPRISALFCRGGPTAILRRVGAVVVDAVERMFGVWAFTHIFEEIRKRAEPTVTDDDSAAPVVLILLERFRVAARFHRFPGAIFGGLSGSSALSMRNSMLALAPTILRFAVAEVRQADNSFCAADTSAEGSSYRPSPVRGLAPKLDYGQGVEKIAYLNVGGFHVG